MLLTDCCIATETAPGPLSHPRAWMGFCTHTSSYFLRDCTISSFRLESLNQSLTWNLTKIWPVLATVLKIPFNGQMMALCNLSTRACTSAAVIVLVWVEWYMELCDMPSHFHTSTVSHSSPCRAFPFLWTCVCTSRWWSLETSTELVREDPKYMSDRRISVSTNDTSWQ
jgi:hypothetical protein